MNDDIEVWAKIEGYPNYEVSSFGNVRRGERILKAGCSSHYLCISLFRENKRKRFSVHRLVAKAFIPNPDNKSQVNHIDGNKLNNHVSNLEWITHLENIHHAIRNGLIKRNGKDNPRWESEVVMFSLQGEKLLEFDTLKDASSWIRENTKYDRAQNASISSVCNGACNRKIAYGYIWRRKNKLNGKDKVKPIIPRCSTWEGKVQAFTLNMEFVKEFESSREASEWVSFKVQRKIPSRDITSVFNLPTRSAYGYRWTFEPQKF